MNTEIETTLATSDDATDNSDSTMDEPVETPNPRGESQEIRGDYPKSIFRAPLTFRYNRASDFEPKFVSIGPYYHGRESLQAGEDLKLKCTEDLLGKRSVGVSSFNLANVPVDPFSHWESDVRSFYKEKIECSSDDFIRMLVVDSCFIIRIIISTSQEVQESISFLDMNIKEVRSDLLLLENQIPLFFIEEVYYWLGVSKSKSTKFETVLGAFISLDMRWGINPSVSYDAAHLLHLYWKCSVSPRVDLPPNFFRTNHYEQQPVWAEILRAIIEPKLIPNATELRQKARVKFKNGVMPGLDVKFWNGNLHMPCLKIDSSWTTLILNLLAFEHSVFPPNKQIFTSYMSFMDSLIDSEMDVELLQKSGVIHNTLRDHKMAATFFNEIGSICIMDHRNHFLRELILMLHEYYNSSWNRTWTSLRRNYFGNRWAGISVGAGATLLILSVLQTCYTIAGYYHQQH